MDCRLFIFRPRINWLIHDTYLFMKTLSVLSLSLRCHRKLETEAMRKILTCINKYLTNGMWGIQVKRAMKKTRQMIWCNQNEAKRRVTIMMIMLMKNRYMMTKWACNMNQALQQSHVIWKGTTDVGHFYPQLLEDDSWWRRGFSSSRNKRKETRTITKEDANKDEEIGADKLLKVI